MRNQFFLAVMLLVSGVAVGQATFYVPDHFSTIQGALNGAVSGDTIIVRAGTYVENVDFVGKDVVLESESGPEVTIIDGNQAGSVVTFRNGEGPGAVIDGFTITNGSGTTVQFEKRGGGIYCELASPTITNNRVVQNRVGGTATGGGIYCESSGATISGNTISQNSAWSSRFGRGDGAGLYTVGSWGTIQNNLFEGNSSRPYGCGLRGGAILVDLPQSLVVRGNTILRNSSSGSVDGLLVRSPSSPMVVADTLIVEDVLAVDGGPATIRGVTVFGADVLINSSTVMMQDTIVWHDGLATEQHIWVTSGGCTTESTGFGDLRVQHSNLKGGQVGIFVESGSSLTWGPGILSVDPQFVDAVQGDYHLTHTSPCKNAGDPVATGTTDFEGDPRIVGGRIDMGADEFHPHLYYTGNPTPGGNIQLKIIGEPGDLAHLWFGTGVLQPALQTPFGDWHLSFPALGVPLGLVGTEGVAQVPVTIPGILLSMSLPMQGAAQLVLTNLELLRIE